MSIDEALETIKGERWIACSEKYREAMNLITDTIYKYQKIQEIYERFQKDGNYYHHMAWLDVIEVLEDEETD